MSKSLSISTDYTPPFQLADDILSLVVEIAEVVVIFLRISKKEYRLRSFDEKIVFVRFIPLWPSKTTPCLWNR